MRAHECYHCKQWVEENEPHDCASTTETALTAELSDDLRDAWERLRETAVEFGEQRIYASHNSIMFARKACYFFVRPKRKALEVVIFLGRILKDPQVRRAEPSSKVKVANFIHITHRDEVEPPFTDWLQEAYNVSPNLAKAPHTKVTKGTKGTKGTKDTKANKAHKGRRTAKGAKPRR